MGSDDVTPSALADAGPASGLSPGRLLAFALPAGPSQAVDTPLSVYAPAFYAAQSGMGLGMVGVLFSIARLAEIPLGMMAGAASDRWGGRHRRKFWLALATPVMVIAVWALFSPPASAGAAYLLGWLLALTAGAALFWINHAAWGGEITRDYHGRTGVQGARQAVSVTCTILVLVAPVLIERAGFSGFEALRMRSIAWFAAISLPLSVAAALLWAPERPLHRPSSGQGLREAVQALLGDRLLRILLLANLADSAALGVVTSLFLFLAADAWGLGRLSSLMLLGYLVSGVICLGPIVRLARARAKHRTVAVIAVLLALALPLLLLVPRGAAGWAMACMALLGAPSAVNSALFESLMGDVADADAVLHGRPRTGLFYSLHLIVGRVGRGAAIAAGFGLLNRMGFHPHAANSAGILTGFKLLYVGAPAALQLCIAGLMWRFPFATDPRAAV
jgi:GPH family glycoside/pentoside/hexuronide:cation symporter